MDFPSSHDPHDNMLELGMGIEACFNEQSMQALRSKNHRTRLSTYLAVRKTLEIISDRVNQTLDKLPIILATQWRLDDALALASAHTDYGESFSPEALEYLVRYFQERLNETPDDTTIPQELSDQIRELGTLITKQLSISSFSPEMHYVVAEYFHRIAKDEEQAIRHYDSAMNEYSEDPRPFVAAGMIHLKNENYELAVGCLERAAELGTTDIEVIRGLVRARAALGDPVTFKSAYDRYVSTMIAHGLVAEPACLLTERVESEQDLTDFAEILALSQWQAAVDPRVSSMIPDAIDLIDRLLEEVEGQLAEADFEDPEYARLIVRRFSLREYAVLILLDSGHLIDYLESIRMAIEDDGLEAPIVEYIGTHIPSIVRLHMERLSADYQDKDGDGSITSSLQDSDFDEIDRIYVGMEERLVYVLERFRDHEQNESLVSMSEILTELDFPKELQKVRDLIVWSQDNLNLRESALLMLDPIGGMTAKYEQMIKKADGTFGEYHRRDIQYRAQRLARDPEWATGAILACWDSTHLRSLLMIEFLLGSSQLDSTTGRAMVGLLPDITLDIEGVWLACLLLAQKWCYDLALGHSTQDDSFLHRSDVFLCALAIVTGAPRENRPRLLALLWDKIRRTSDISVEDLIGRYLKRKRASESEKQECNIAMARILSIREEFDSAMQYLTNIPDEQRRSYESLRILEWYGGCDPEVLREHIRAFHSFSVRDRAYYNTLTAILRLSAELGDFATFAAYARLVDEQDYLGEMTVDPENDPRYTEDQKIPLGDLRISLHLRWGEEEQFWAIKQLPFIGKDLSTDSLWLLTSYIRSHQRSDVCITDACWLKHYLLSYYILGCIDVPQVPRSSCIEYYWSILSALTERTDARENMSERHKSVYESLREMLMLSEDEFEEYSHWNFAELIHQHASYTAGTYDVLFERADTEDQRSNILQSHRRFIGYVIDIFANIGLYGAQFKSDWMERLDDDEWSIIWRSSVIEKEGE